MLMKFAICSFSLILAGIPVIDDVADSANKVGTLGMQGLLVFMMLCLMMVIWYQERKRTADRQARDTQQAQQYANLLKHHEAFAEEAKVERSGFHLEMKAHAKELCGLTERSIVAMHAMANSTDALRIALEHQEEERKQLAALKAKLQLENSK